MYIKNFRTNKGKEYKAKIINKKCFCVICNKDFLSADIKSKYCKECKRMNSVCSCGKKKFFRTSNCYFCSKKQLEGLSKEEIIKKYPNWKNCGFRKGKLNSNFYPGNRERRSEGIKRSYTPELRKIRSIQKTFNNIKGGFGRKKFKNSYEEFYRSSLEVDFSNFLHENNIKFYYEVPIKMINGRYKIIDFKVGEVYIEISGLAYEAWQKDFKNKMQFLRQTIDNPIIILTYSNKEYIVEDILDYNMTVNSIEILKRPKYLKEKLDFWNNIYELNKVMKNEV